MRKITPLAAAAMLGLGLHVSAQVTTDPVGFTTVSLLANSDTYVGIPFTRIPAFTAAVSSVSGGTITFSGTPFTASQFVYSAGVQADHFFVLLGTGSPSNPKEGHKYAITGNANNSISVDVSQDDFAGVPVGTQAVIIPYWTLGTLFPAGNQNVSFTPTTSTRAFKTEILIPNFGAGGINQAFSTVYYFSNNVNGTTGNVGWRVVGDNTTSHDDDALFPDGYFVVRNQNSAPTLPLSPLGAVLTKKSAIMLATQAASPQDNSVAMIRPVDVSVNSTGLTPADGSFVATTLTRSFKDELLLFDNSVAAFNKSPVAVYFYSNNVNGTTGNVGWRVIGDNTTDHGPDLIPSGAAIILRKAANGTGGPVYWANSPTY